MVLVCLKTLAPRYRFKLGNEGRLYSITTNFYGEQVYVPVQIIINGMGAEPGGSTNVSQLMGLTADDIEYIYINDGYVDIKTLGVPRSVRRSLESGIIHIAHPGYYQARAFNEQYPEGHDLATTIHWDPRLEKNEAGQYVIRIPGTKLRSGYILTVEGVSTRGDVISFSSEDFWVRDHIIQGNTH